jgi:hypothetical protein
MIWSNGSNLWKWKWRQSCLIGNQVVSLLMTPVKSCEHYDEYESYHTSFFIIMLIEDQKFSLSKVFFILTKLTMYLHI